MAHILFWGTIFGGIILVVWALIGNDSISVVSEPNIFYDVVFLIFGFFVAIDGAIGLIKRLF